MIVFRNMAKANYKEYKNKNTKLTRDIKNGKLIRIKNGLYETDPNTPAYLLAQALYGPSYISFEYALSCYGLIPERVYIVTCATYNKKKKKEYNTPFGYYTYRDIPKKAYPQEVLLKVEGNYSYQIASPEKALCDKLYTLKPIQNYKDLEHMLFENLRIYEDEFDTLDSNKIQELSKLYHSTNVKLLAKYMRRKTNE